ncbi:MAG: YhjD/YihY/BrkB family envelope integrity protein, partial [Ilumatobacteraceae bacterium]
ATVTGIRALVARGKGTVTAGQARANDLLEKYQDRPLLDVGLRIYRRDRESAGTVVGSALAFRLFLFFIPFLLFVVGTAGFVARVVDEDDVSEAGISGSLARQINAALTQPDSTRWIAVGLGFVGMITTGRSLSKVMVSASCLAWQLPVRAKASFKVIGAVVGLIAGIGLVAAIVNRVRLDLGLAVTGMSYLVALGIYAAAWVLLSLLLPRATTDPGALLPGAVLTSLTLVGMQAVSQLYLPSRFTRASELYGAIGTTIVTLGWFFILGRAMVLAMAINAVIYERFGSISHVVFALPVVRVIPRRSERIRRFFELDR